MEFLFCLLRKDVTWLSSRLSGLDGVDQWASIKEEKEKSPHQFVIHNVDKDPLHNTWQVGFLFCLFVCLSMKFNVQAAITYNQWKLIWGQVKIRDVGENHLSF